MKAIKMILGTLLLILGTFFTGANLLALATAQRGPTGMPIDGDGQEMAARTVGQSIFKPAGVALTGLILLGIGNGKKKEQKTQQSPAESPRTTAGLSGPPTTSVEPEPEVLKPLGRVSRTSTHEAASKAA
ncbi:MAG: hypothetical protein AAF586_02520 [Planctomycetota bacterium]